jgi:hypothetical protein
VLVLGNDPVFEERCITLHLVAGKFRLGPVLCQGSLGLRPRILGQGQRTPLLSQVVAYLD